MARQPSNSGPIADEEQGVLPMRAPKRQADRNGKRNIGGMIPVPIARGLAILAAKSDKTQLALLEEALADLFKKYNHRIEP